MDSKPGNVPQWVWIALGVVGLVIVFFLFFKKKKQEPQPEIFEEEIYLTENAETPKQNETQKDDQEKQA